MNGGALRSCPPSTARRTTSGVWRRRSPHRGAVAQRSVAAAQGDLRWHLGALAAAASLLWFSALGMGARLLRPVFARPGAWRALDALIAVVMLMLAVGLLRG